MRRIRKFISGILAVTMALCSSLVCFAEENDIYAEAIEDSGIIFQQKTL